MSDPTNYVICGIVCECGPNGEPLACGYLRGHDGDHAWATLPTWTQGDGDHHEDDDCDCTACTAKKMTAALVRLAKASYGQGFTHGQGDRSTP